MVKNVWKKTPVTSGSKLKCLVWKFKQKNIHYADSWFTRQTFLENGQSLCDGKFLNRKNYPDIKRNRKISRSNPLDSRKGMCRLIQFNMDHVVTCLDHLYYQSQFFRGFTENETYGTFPSAELTFLFVGDSRVRQQFYNFLKVKYLQNCCFMLKKNFIEAI